MCAEFENEKDIYIGNSDLYRAFVECNLTISARNKILNILRKYTNPNDILSLPRTFQTAVGQYPDFQIKNIDVVVEDRNSSLDEDEGEDENENINQFIYFGLERSIQNKVAKFNIEASHIYLNINIDGLPLFKNSKKTFWSILGQFDGGYAVFPIALYYSQSSKPTDNKLFLEDFVNEITDIQCNGVSLDGRQYKVHLQNGIFDSPARSFVLATPYFNSYCGCYRCTVEGVYIQKRMCFLDGCAPLRTVNDPIFNCVNSPILRVMNPITSIPLDTMHVVDLGVGKKLMYLWTNRISLKHMDEPLNSKKKKEKTRSKFSLRPCDQLILTSKLKKLAGYCPREFNRRVRQLNDLAFYTAKGYRMILLYIGPVVFQDILPADQYYHFLSLHVAYRLLNDHKAINDSDKLEYARTLLDKFVTDFSSVYAPALISFNIHALLHLVNDVEKLQKTVYNFSAYPFENYNKQLKALVKSAHLPAIQVARRVHEMTVYQSHQCNEEKKVGLCRSVAQSQPGYKKFLAYRTQDFYFDNSAANRFCEVNSERIFMIHYFNLNIVENETYVYGTYLDETEALYTIPCVSSYVDIVTTCINFEPECLSSVNVRHLTGKYMCLPTNAIDQTNRNHYALIKLLHCKSICCLTQVHTYNSGTLFLAKNVYGQSFINSKS